MKDTFYHGVTVCFLHYIKLQTISDQLTQKILSFSNAGFRDGFVKAVTAKKHFIQ